jgi:hypothetical protein
VNVDRLTAEAAGYVQLGMLDKAEGALASSAWQAFCEFLAQLVRVPANSLFEFTYLALRLIETGLLQAS